MILGEFRQMTKRMPDTIRMDISNLASEWYGAETMDRCAWREVDKVLVFFFCNTIPDDSDIKGYRERLI